MVFFSVCKTFNLGLVHEQDHLTEGEEGPDHEPDHELDPDRPEKTGEKYKFYFILDEGR